MPVVDCAVLHEVLAPALRGTARRAAPEAAEAAAAAAAAAVAALARLEALQAGACTAFAAGVLTAAAAASPTASDPAVQHLRSVHRQLAAVSNGALPLSITPASRYRTSITVP